MAMDNGTNSPKILTTRLIEVSVLRRRQLYCGKCKNFVLSEKIFLDTMLLNETDGYLLVAWMASMQASSR